MATGACARRPRADSARSARYRRSPELGIALADRSWWVRFRCALALAQLGETGGGRCEAARDRTDRYAADMATMVSGLSDGAVVEFAEA